MGGKIIVIAGYLASGKSTFAARLSGELQIPYLIKDTFKIAICDSLPVNSREESSRFSAVTFDAMMYVTQRHLETACPLIIEGNFVPFGVKKVDEAGVIQALIKKYGCQPLTYKFKGDTQVLHKRYIERDKTPGRGQVNAMNSDISYADFDRVCHNLDSFAVGGEIIEIDTTNFAQVDFASHIDHAHKFMMQDESPCQQNPHSTEQEKIHDRESQGIYRAL
jgi:predicted kinase